jgi:pimeloyl-ACP methyl ester carboxylesterase
MTTYALLVGIDDYQSPVNPLHGCVADIQAIHSVLGSRISNEQLDVRILLNQQATRSAVIEQFRSHLARAKDGDAVVFWYSGHGSRQATSAAPGLEPDGYDETLVLYDSRTPNGTDLADKELAALIKDVALVGVHVFVGLDCCNSGSGTRDVFPEDGAVRRTATAERVRVRSDATYLAAPEVPGRHVLLTGCRSDQLSKEVWFEGVRRGAMSAAAQRAIRDAGPTMTYRELHRTVRAFVGQTARDQVPQLELTNSEDAVAMLFHGALGEREPGYLLSFTGARWELDAGAVHGISSARGTATTQLDVRDPDTDATVAHAVVGEVFPDTSVVTVDGQLDTNRTYRALITAVPLPETPVELHRDLDELRAAIDGSPFLAVADSGASIVVRRVDGGIEIVDVTRGPDPVTRIADDPIVVRLALEQMVRWRQILELDNPGSGLTGAELEVVVPGDAGSDTVAVPQPGGEILLEYGASGAPTFKIRVRNLGTVPLYCGVVALGADYAVTSLLPGGVERLEPNGPPVSKQIKSEISDELWSHGVVRLADTMKLIVSGAQFDPEVLVQDGLPNPILTRTRGDRAAEPSSTLARLLERVQDRGLSPVTGPEPVADWSAATVNITTERPQPGTSVTGRVELAPGVTLQVPDGFTAKASLTSSEVVARDLTARMVPPLLIDQPEPWAPLALLPVRDAAAPLDVLELQDVEGYDAVDPNSPMTLQLDQPLADGESVVVIGFDGRNYLPVGHSIRATEAHDAVSGTTIVIDQLPPAIDTRSLTSSIRLLFRRFVHKLTGGPVTTTRLAIPSVHRGEVSYDDDADRLAAAVAQADQILLLIHGILGDTAGLAVGAAAGFGGTYDLTLTFDYENINTPIDETAADLQKKLRAAGVASKQLDVVAHSMGGLVSRWLIEQDRAGLVSHLITAGTPNGGSPWPVLQGWATAALAFGLNKLQQVFWPTSLLSGLVALIEGVDQALDDMEPSSKRLASLLASTDPDVRYTVLYGDRSLVEVQRNGRVKEILDWVKRGAVDVATAMAFLNQPNDLAVSVTSARTLPTFRRLEIVGPVHCDHVTFFSSEAGLAALSAAVASEGP